MKKFTVLLAFIFAFSISIPIYAESSTGGHYKIVESHKQITNNNELIRLAIQQKSAGAHTKNFLHNSKTGSLNNGKTFKSEQLLERKIYDDGTIEETYVTNSIGVTDNNLLQIDASNVVSAVFSPTATTYFYADDSKSTTKSNGSVNVAQTLYYTMRYSDPLGSDLAFHVSRVETNITQGSSYCTSMQFGYHILYNIDDYHYYRNINRPTSGVYAVDSGNSGYYPISGGIWNSIYSYFSITLTSGSLLEDTIYI